MRVVTLDGLGIWPFTTPPPPPDPRARSSKTGGGGPAPGATLVNNDKGIAEMSFDEKEADAASAAALAADDATRARAAARRASNPRVPAPPLPLVDDPVGSVSEAQIWGWRIALYGTMAGMLIGVAAVARKAL